MRARGKIFPPFHHPFYIPDSAPGPGGAGLRPGDRPRFSQFSNLALPKQVGVVDAAPERHAPKDGVVGQAVDLVEILGAVRKGLRQTSGGNVTSQFSNLKHEQEMC